MKRLIYTTTTCDGIYWPQAKVALYSLYLNGCSNDDVIVDIIDGNKLHEATLKKLNKNIVKINHIKISSADRKALLYTRPFGIKKYIPSLYFQVASIDTDIIIRKPIDSIWVKKGFRSPAIKFYHRKKLSPRLRLQGGVVVYNNTMMLSNYYDEVVRSVEKTEKINIYQVNLYNYCKQFCIDMIDMSESFNDMYFKPKSAIWHCKHKRFGDAIYQKEFNKYLERADRFLSQRHPYNSGLYKCNNTHKGLVRKSSYKIKFPPGKVL